MTAHQLVGEALDEINLRLPRARRLAAAPETVLLGPGSRLDSADLVDLVMLLEQRLERHLGRPMPIALDGVFDPDTGPLRTVATLEAHLETLIRTAP
jgi:hypothetical protein